MACADSHSFCEPIHSEDTNLFQTMKKPTTEASKYRKTAPFRLLPVISHFGKVPVVRRSLVQSSLFPQSVALWPLSARPSPISYLPSSPWPCRSPKGKLFAQTFLKNFGPCAGCNTVCDPIHSNSRDTHLFRIMKNQLLKTPKYRSTLPHVRSFQSPFSNFQFWNINGRFPASYRLAA